MADLWDMWELTVEPLLHGTEGDLAALLETYPLAALTIADVGSRPVFSDQERFAGSRLVALVDRAAHPEVDLAMLEVQTRLWLAASGETTATVCCRPVPEQNWQESWKEQYHPIEIGPHLVILPTWLPEEAWIGRLLVRIDPEMAFGSGHHETTHGCLRALVDRAASGPLGNVLDIGTGSGILAIAALKLGARHVFATDLDPVAVTTCQKNATLNGYTDRELHCELRHDLPDGRFDVVVANLLLDTILLLLGPDSQPAIPDVVAEGGIVIFSGLLAGQVDRVRDACRAHGLESVECILAGEWAIVTARHPVGADNR
jgi:ribosomal protein L11 methyltransferase